MKSEQEIRTLLAGIATMLGQNGPSHPKAPQLTAQYAILRLVLEIPSCTCPSDMCSSITANNEVFDEWIGTVRAAGEPGERWVAQIMAVLESEGALSRGSTH